MKTYGAYDRYSGEYITEVRAENFDAACAKLDSMSLTELVVHTAGTTMTPYEFQHRVGNSIIKEIP